MLAALGGSPCCVLELAELLFARLQDLAQRAAGLLGRGLLWGRPFGGLGLVAPGALLHGLVHLSETQRVLELGTAFGLSGLYIARGLLDSFPVRTCYFVTIERNRQFARIAEDNFDKLGYLDFVHVIQGDFETELERALDLIKPLQMAYIDGNHDCDATLRYVSQLKARARPGSLIILDDIHWSPEMTRAWRTIQQMPRVAATVDLWQWGIVVTGPRPTETDQALHLSARL